MYEVERKAVVKAMETIARNVNDEIVFNGWLMNGVADGDLEYNDFANYDEVDDYYIEDNNFQDIMRCFLRVMKRAYNSGGLYCDGICSGDKEDDMKQ